MRRPKSAEAFRIWQDGLTNQWFAGWGKRRFLDERWAVMNEFDSELAGEADPSLQNVGVACGVCGGQVYFERCMDSRPTEHYWATASECQQCGERYLIPCPECDGEDTGQ